MSTFTWATFLIHWCHLITPSLTKNYQTKQMWHKKALDKTKSAHSFLTCSLFNKICFPINYNQHELFQFPNLSILFFIIYVSLSELIANIKIRNCSVCVVFFRCTKHELCFVYFFLFYTESVDWHWKSGKCHFTATPCLMYIHRSMFQQFQNS